MATVHLIISGRVQGVGFRYFAQESAQIYSLAGWVRNKSDGTVEAYAEGDKSVLEGWVEKLHRGPMGARVASIQTNWQAPQENLTGFSIR